MTINTTNPEFEVGDWIVAVGSSSGYTKGELYKVSKVGVSVVSTKTDDHGSTTNGWGKEKFQKVRFLGEWNGEGELPKYILRPTYNEDDGAIYGAFSFSRECRLSTSYVKDGMWWWRSSDQIPSNSDKTECTYRTLDNESVKYMEPLKLAWTHPDFKYETVEKEEPASPEPPVQKPLASGLKTMESDFYFLIINEDKYFDD